MKIEGFKLLPKIIISLPIRKAAKYDVFPGKS